MKSTKPCFFMAAGDQSFDMDGEPNVLVNERYIHITEDEYRFFLDHLKAKKAIDAEGNRIDGRAEETQHPVTCEESEVN